MQTKCKIFPLCKFFVAETTQSKECRNRNEIHNIAKSCKPLQRNGWGRNKKLETIASEPERHRALLPRYRHIGKYNCTIKYMYLEGSELLDKASVLRVQSQSSLESDLSWLVGGSLTKH